MSLTGRGSVMVDIGHIVGHGGCKRSGLMSGKLMTRYVLGRGSCRSGRSSGFSGFGWVVSYACRVG